MYFKDGVYHLKPLPGSRVYNEERKLLSIDKDSNRFLAGMVEAYGAEKLLDMMEVDIGDYTLEKGINHSLNMNVGRAIPWVEDGLKSIERRVLFIMWQSKLYGGKMDKVSGITGNMISLVYPHGDAAAADTIYRLGRTRTMLLPYVIEGGSFGNMYDLKPASPRYAEGGLTNYAYDCFFSETGDINSLYDEKDNYKYSGKEPVFLTSRFPNILMQWNLGIGKGASTQLCGYNSKDVFKAALALLDDPEAKIDIYPDTPVPIDIINKSELKGCFDKVSFKVKMRANYEIIADKKRDSNGKVVDKPTIVFTSLPFGVSGEMVENQIKKIKEEDLTKTTLSEKRLPEVVNIEPDADDESAGGIRFTIEYEKGYDPNALVEKLIKSTSLGHTIGVKNVLVNDNQSVEVTARQTLIDWLIMRFDQKRRYYHQKVLGAAKDRSKYEAIATILHKDNVDKAIMLVRTAKTDEDAVKALREEFDFTEFQALQVLAINIKNLAKKNVESTIAKRDKAIADYKHYRKMLASEDAIKEAIREDLEYGLATYGRKRIATLRNMKAGSSEETTDTKRIFYSADNMITVAGAGNLPKSLFNNITSKFKMVEVQNHDKVILVSSRGSIKVLDGYAFNNSSHLISTTTLGMSDLASIIRIPKTSTGYEVILVTKNGYGKRMSIDECTKSTKGKLIAVPADDSLVSAMLVKVNNPDTDLLMIAQDDLVSYLRIVDIPQFKRSSLGNRLIKPSKGNKTISVTGAYVYTGNGYIVIYGDSGYAKILDDKVLTYSKKGPNTINFRNKAVLGVASINDHNSAGVCCTIDGEQGYTIKVVGAMAHITMDDKTSYKMKLSTSISNPVKILKVARKEYYSM